MAKIKLSKSKIIAGLQCPKRLWLQVHRPDLLRESEQTQQSYDNGNQLGVIAQSLYPDGMLIEDIFNPPKALADTQETLLRSQTIPIFEAAFSHDDVLIRADLTFKDCDGLRVVEVKSSTSVKEYHLNDCAIQSWVIESAGYNLKQIELAHVDSSFVYEGDGNYHGILSHENVTEQIEPLKQQVKDWVIYFKNVLESDMPEISTGTQCRTPFDCPFNDFCNPNPPEFPLTLLSYSKKFIQEMQNQGIFDVRGVPQEILKTEKQHRILEATLSGKAIIVELHSELTHLSI